jgi:predicted membrane-bound spermidine synthase
MAPAVSQRVELAYWQKMHGEVRQLKATAETPYQKLQLSSYWDQKSLFSNGMLTDSWPLAESAESRVHTFVSALKNYRRVLVIGAPTPDVIDEFIKYGELRLTIVESDADLVAMLDYSPEQLARVEVVNTDPRFYLNQAGQKFDGIMFNAISPVTLAGNRLFTSEAFRAAKAMLQPEGVISLQVQGAENYLNQTLGKLIISTWQALRLEFAHCLAIPGNVITFFASQSNQVLPQNAREFSDRFSARQISTTTFFPMSFHNLLMPHRVKELEEWLKRDIKVKLNSDAHPVSFMQQIELWNIYSGTTLNTWLPYLQQIPLFKLLVIFLAIAAVLMFIPAFLSTATAVKTVIAGGVAISGATGILSEIILILLYQNRFGAAYQMTALFFGLYMIGLASGAMLFGRVQLRKTAISRLKLVKLLQILFSAFCIVFVSMTQQHFAAMIGLMIYLIAFLDGIEFPVADSILRSTGRQAADSAGLLISADNCGALLAGALSGLWLLPAIGMRACFSILCAALVFNLVALLIFAHRLHDGDSAC